MALTKDSPYLHKLPSEQTDVDLAKCLADNYICEIGKVLISIAEQLAAANVQSKDDINYYTMEALNVAVAMFSAEHRKFGTTDGDLASMVCAAQRRMHEYHRALMRCVETAEKAGQVMPETNAPTSTTKQ